jgi:hypothetical protein
MTAHPKPEGFAERRRRQNTRFDFVAARPQNGRDFFFFTWRFTNPASRPGRGHFAQNDTLQALRTWGHLVLACDQQRAAKTPAFAEKSKGWATRGCDQTAERYLTMGVETRLS